MSVLRVAWQPVCCGDHIAYAEGQTRNGGVVRLYRHADGGMSMTRFAADHSPIDADPAGVPIAVRCTEADVVDMLA